VLFRSGRKATWNERLQWTEDNLFTVTRVAVDPIANIGDWEAAEEPWQFLAACDEYYHCCIKCDRHVTGLPVATDATCSGLQILAGLARDKETAQLVNVLPSDRPQDAYKVVAEVSKWNIPDRLREIWDRKCVKRTVMTIPYNAKPFSNRAYIRDALKEKDIEIEKDELTQTVKAVRDAMSIKFPGPMSVMKWIEDEVAKAITRGVEEIAWVTPSGFIVTQRIMKKKVERLQLQLLGVCEIRVATDDPKKVDRARHKAATAPNLIHSLDASLLHLSVERFNSPIALIHDSVLCRATDMSVLSHIIRETYMDLFAKQDYLNDFAKQIMAETEPPIIDTLDEGWSVIDSNYFFC
jgi:DNA-directed RNA polymerase